jgi:hypothetical protein
MPLDGIDTNGEKPAHESWQVVTSTLVYRSTIASRCSTASPSPVDWKSDDVMRKACRTGRMYSGAAGPTVQKRVFSTKRGHFRTKVVRVEFLLHINFSQKMQG